MFCCRVNLLLPEAAAQHFSKFNAYKGYTVEGGEKKNTAETNEGGNCFISAEVAQMGADDARAGIFRQLLRLLFIYFGQVSPLYRGLR